MNGLLIRLSENPGLDEGQRAEIEASFGPRGRKALAALDACKVKKYHDFFVVERRTAEYVVDEDFCTCNDFLYRGRTCWHLIAVQIAVATGKFTRVDGWYTDQLK
jgi:predicted nucleic acid-binding Zn finger protein